MKPFIHILYLEDNPADAELIQATLESADLTCQITRVQTRDDFSQALRQSCYDVIFADYRLPAYDGLSALRLSLERCPETPFIFISGTMGEDAAIEGLTEGATDYVLKQKLSRLVPAVTRALREAENRKERKRAEAALRDSEARYRRITEAITDYMYTVRVVEGQAVETRHGPGCLAVTGYSTEEFAADPYLWIRMVVVDDRPAVQEQARRILAGEPAPAIEHRIVRKDGAVHWVCNTPVPRRDGQGVLQSYDGLIQDITGRKQAEEALRESERLLADIAANYPHSYLSIIEKDFTIGFTSGQEFKKQHLDPKSFEGLSLEQVFGEQTPTVREQYRKAFQGEETSFELFINNQHQLYNVVPLYDQHGHVARILAVVENITERKRTEEELTKHREHLEELVAERTAALEQEINERKRIEHALHEAKDAAEAANRAKSEFLANMSHELRTPLNAILGYAQLLKREKNLTAKQRDQLNTIHSSGEYLLTLISDLLDLTRIEAQRMEVDVTPFNLPAFLRNILDASRLKTKERNLFVRYDEVSPIPAVVKGDERKLRQVLLNLLDNAIKYTEHGGVTLRVRLLDGEMGRRGEREMERRGEREFGSASPDHPITRSPHLLFEVEDTGIGISGEQMEAIFEPFTRVERRPTEGIGLGLAICRKLVELMGGRLSVDSEVGTGSTFTVEVELEVVESLELAPKEPEKTVIGYQGERKRLLIVDDNIINLSMLVSILDSLGFAIETADSGEEALQKAGATRPDLILLDLLMSGMNGDEALRQIRRMKGLEHVRVIGVSAAIADKARAGQFAAACDDFLSKPVDIEELLETLQALLQLDWIEEGAEIMEPPPSAEGSSGDIDTPEKWPPQTVVDDLLDKVEWGDFTRLENILDCLEAEDNEYKGFCETIRVYARRFDDDAIINYLS